MYASRMRAVERAAARAARPVARRLALAILVAGGLAVGGAAAQTYPSRPIRFLIPFAPGGVGDLTSRVVAQKMSENLGQQIVIDNRPGAGMIVTADVALKADADGYTLVLMGNGTAISASLFKSLPYDALRDFAHVSTISFFDLVLLTNPASKFQTVGDVLAYAKANPGKLDLGTVSMGSTQSLAAELFKSMAGIDAQTVPYKATPALMNAVRANDVPLAFEILGGVMSQIRSKALRPIAVTTEKRSSLLPEVPTIAESGVPGYSANSWNGISVRSGTPRPIIDRLAREVAVALAAPEVQKRMHDLGVEPRAMSPEDTRALFAADIVKWRAVIERARIERQ